VNFQCSKIYHTKDVFVVAGKISLPISRGKRDLTALIKYSK